MSDKTKARLKGIFEASPKIEELYVAGGQVFYEQHRATAFNEKVEKITRLAFFAQEKADKKSDTDTQGKTTKPEVKP